MKDKKQKELRVVFKHKMTGERVFFYLLPLNSDYDFIKTIMINDLECYQIMVNEGYSARNTYLAKTHYQIEEIMFVEE